MLLPTKLHLFFSSSFIVPLPGCENILRVSSRFGSLEGSTSGKKEYE